MSYFLARINPGARVSVDRHYETSGKDFESEKIFLGRKQSGRNHNYCILVAPGYGSKCKYVNGSIYARVDDVEFITPICLLESLLLDGHRYV